MDESKRPWRQLAVWLPVAFVAAVSAGAVFGLGRFLPDAGVVAVITGLAGVGAAAFSFWVFRSIERAQRQTRQRARHLGAINEASLALASDLELASVLQRVVELSRTVTGARYGALATVDDEGRIMDFLTSGLTAEERERIGSLPEGRGLLGAVIDESATIRVDVIAEDSRSAGFPPNHPHMTSFIGMPVVYEGRTFGDLYLTDKDGGAPFTNEDEEVLRTFAAHAAVAIENARLYRDVQDLVVLEERDRIGMDLHDGVIQSLYATRLTLENCLADLADDPTEAEAQLNKALDQLTKTTADIRGYVVNLRPTELVDTDLAGAVGALLQELRVNALLDVKLAEQPGACRGLSDAQSQELFHVAKESLTNVRRHAHASSVEARLAQRNGSFSMAIIDDGVGFDSSASSHGQGLRNMRERVAAIGGNLEIESSDGGTGTRLTVQLPLEKEDG